MHRQLLFPTCAGFVSYPPLPDTCLDTGGSRCLRWSVPFRASPFHCIIDIRFGEGEDLVRIF